ncbi:efflux RND transporter periplasmic adaptor subunit [Xanthobacteraceae bacterium Astr-EGSB]|uniref:HlyD family secretion protein n=1 Tax=Astrobacterium formosum TaxID=3069710 RepID=UPI0027B2675F|nr:efflux RND transporter periplasmic adaptor subunit [Xanthobacteraceae bacterium Astr-EGSB]
MTRASRTFCVIALLAALGVAGCDEGPKPFQGWVEADLIFVGPDEAGRVETLTVREGDQIEAGKPLLSVDADLQKADVSAAEATLANARQVFQRAEMLLKSATGTQRDFDAAQAALREAEARVISAKTRLARRSLASPVTGLVQKVYFRPGEMVAAGRPVVAILPPGNVKIRFFVPETGLARVAYGDDVTVRCDGCTGLMSAKVSFIASSAEYTPPVIFSLEERSKLVYLVEARPSEPQRLKVGQPVDVFLSAKEAKP